MSAALKSAVLDCLHMKLKLIVHAEDLARLDLTLHGYHAKSSVINVVP